MDGPVRPGDYALAADDGIRRRDDDASFDPESVYAPLLEAKPVIEEMGLDAVLEAISKTAGRSHRGGRSRRRTVRLDGTACGGNGGLTRLTDFHN